MKKYKYDGLVNYLSIGDIIIADYDEERHKIRTAIPIYNDDGKFIGDLPRPVILTICSFANNPKSGTNPWFEVKTDTVQGIISPLALIHNFKYVEKK